MHGKPIDSHLIFDLPSVASPAISPDGTAVAYVRGQVDRTAMEARSHIELVLFGGGDARQITAGPYDSKPVWSPDGSTLAFLRCPAPNVQKQVWLLPMEGGEARRLTDAPTGVLDMTWSPDGSAIAYVSDVHPDMPPDDEDQEERKRHPRVRVVSNIYYRGDTLGWRGNAYRHLFRIAVATGKSERLTHGDYDHATPVFSPDGSQLAFESNRSPKRHLRAPFGGELCVMPAGGGRVRRLTPDTWGIGGIAWVPDGRHIACVVTEKAEQSQSYVDIVDVTTRKRTRITGDRLAPQTGFFPIASPPPLTWQNGEVLFAADAHASSGLYRANLESGVHALRAKPEMISGLSSAPGGRRIAFLGGTQRQPSELMALDTRTGRSRLLTHVADEYIAAHPPGRVQRFTVRRGELTIDCWLMFPPGFDRTKRYPLVLEVHGGPNGFYGAGFSPLHQIIAGGGNIVLFVNPRGSTSYGVDFMSRVWGDWGGEDYLDLMAAVDEACRRPYVDGKRLGIHGYSYGGYMASWAVGHTDRFKAAIVGAPCINLSSMYGQTDIGITFGEHQWGGRPPENLDWYLDRSPLTYADRVNTPVLLLHGESDIRCPISQSEEYYVALKRLGKTVEFVRFPGCSHLFLRVGHPEMRRQYYDRVTAWFQRWLS